MRVSPAALSAHLRERQPAVYPRIPGRTSERAAGVLVPLVWREGDIEILVTERPATMPVHPGDICFPGGKPEPSDADLQATALREAHEEIGVATVDVLGPLGSCPLVTSDFRLWPTVARVEESELAPSPREVVRLLRVSVREMLGRDTLDALRWEVEDQSWAIPAVEASGLLICSATSMLVVELLGCIAEVAGVPMPPLDTSHPVELLARLRKRPAATPA